MKHIEVYEDQQYFWWWTLYEDDIVRQRTGSFLTSLDAINAAQHAHPSVGITVVPWHLP